MPVLFSSPRLWGLCLPTHPNIGGTCCLTGDKSWYDEKTRQIVRTWGKTFPGLGEEFHEKAILNQDGAYIRKFFQDLEDAKEGKTVQPGSRAAAAKVDGPDFTGPWQGLNFG